MKKAGVTETELEIELTGIRNQSKQIRIQHCVKRFMIWRQAGLSPNEIKLEYGLGDHDMYGTILDQVQALTGRPRDELLMFPGRGRGERSATTRETKLKEDLSEAQRLIQLYTDMLEQATILQHTIRTTINGGRKNG